MKLAASLAFGLMVFSTHAATVKAHDIPEDMKIDFSNIPGGREQLVCLALNDYWEARGEPLRGRIAVAKVVLNRVADSRYPGDICAVVTERKSANLRACQFSWHCDGRPDTPAELDAWRRSLLVASAVLHGRDSIEDPTQGSLWYHATHVTPEWSRNLDRVTRIGDHIFYRDEDGSEPVYAPNGRAHKLASLMPGPIPPGPDPADDGVHRDISAQVAAVPLP